MGLKTHYPTIKDFEKSIEDTLIYVPARGSSDGTRNSKDDPDDGSQSETRGSSSENSFSQFPPVDSPRTVLSEPIKTLD